MALILPRAFYSQNTITVAKELLGCFLIFEADGNRKIGLISETEAYPGLGDRASHSHKGLTKRTQPLFGPPGHAYIYLIYGIYNCFNVVTDTPESGGAVLIRAVQPIEGITGKTAGPGLLCKAYGLDRHWNNHDLTQPPLVITNKEGEVNNIRSEPRIGIDYAGDDKDKPYRFSIA